MPTGSPADRYKIHRAMVEELLDYDPVPGSPRLSGWEINFIEALAEWDGHFTEKQVVVLERIWAKVM